MELGGGAYGLELRGEGSGSRGDGEAHAWGPNVCWAIFTAGHGEDFDPWAWRGSSPSVTLGSYQTLGVRDDSSLPGAGPPSKFFEVVRGRLEVLPESLFLQNNQLKIIAIPEKATSGWQAALPVTYGRSSHKWAHLPQMGTLLGFQSSLRSTVSEN